MQYSLSKLERISLKTIHPHYIKVWINFQSDKETKLSDLHTNSISTLTNYLCDITIQLNKVPLKGKYAIHVEGSHIHSRHGHSWNSLEKLLFLFRGRISSNSIPARFAWNRKLREERQKKNERGIRAGISAASSFSAFVLAVGSLLEFILENGVSCYLRETFARTFYQLRSRL